VSLSKQEKCVYVFVAVLCVALVGMALLGSQGVPGVRRLQAERETLKAEIADLEKRQAALTEEVQELRENPKAIERRARQELGMIRDGETVIQLKSEKHGSR
jgi:cell division protein FtsB